MAKVVSGAKDEQDCYMVHLAGQQFENNCGIPYIGLCLGEAGQLSRVLNKRFTPVTHPAMSAAAPGQLSAAELMSRRLSLSLSGCTPKQFYLFGSPISFSLSPAMHNAAFSQLLLPHKYDLNEREKERVGEYEREIREGSFGGASVTIPHKESIIQYLDEVRGAALEIGAVNTIVVERETEREALTQLFEKVEEERERDEEEEREGEEEEEEENLHDREEEREREGEGERERKRLVGMNTDWLGIRRPVARQLQKRGKPFQGTVGLVIGAGGTAMAACYAVRDLQLDLVVYNRTPEKAKAIADRFGGRVIDNLEDFALSLSSSSSLSLSLVISTVPSAASFSLPLSLLDDQPVVLDVVYKPARTKLLTQALEANCLVVQGARMLHEQAMEQFELWTGRKAPGHVMEGALFKDLEML